VVKSVPPHATVVGVPGHIIEPRADEHSERRAAVAQRIGFDAYGATRSAPDPVAHAVNCMLDHIHVVDEKLQALGKALETLGIRQDLSHLPTLDALEIISAGEDPPNGEPADAEETALGGKVDAG
jgi:serine O-acetyltransferase